MTIEKWAEVVRIIREGGIPVYDFAETAARVLSAMTGYGKFIKRKAPTYKRYKHDKKAARAIIGKHRGKGRFIPSDDVFAILKCFGIRAAKTVRIKKEGELKRASKRVGFPMVLKVDAESILHKSDVGGVALGIKSERALLSAYTRMARKFAKAEPAFILQEYLAGGKEVIMGIKGGEGSAPMLMFGLGGVFVETMKDVQFRLAPLSAEDALDMILSIRGYPILEGVRGDKSVDMDKLAETLMRLSQLGSAFPEIAEMDINPVLVFEKGGGAAVVDARIRIL
jgi:acyl-CoA synthetase (NDP forming)